MKRIQIHVYNLSVSLGFCIGGVIPDTIQDVGKTEIRQEYKEELR